jgi:hypothetical protein
MKKLILILVILVCNTTANAQNRSGDSWIMGGWRGIEAKFENLNAPILSIKYDTLFPTFPYYFIGGHSNICDKITGSILLSCNGMQLFDSLGNIISNGDSLQPIEIYLKDAHHTVSLTQNSIILPKDEQNQYYMITSTVSDTTYNKFWTGASGIPKAPYDMILCHTIDLSANNGQGAVIEKNKILLKDKEIYKVGMQACRHANGRDWWLLKQGGYDKNEIIRFLVTKDSIYGPYIQTFALPKHSYRDLTGQLAFSKDGKKFASVMAKSDKVFLADFDRCTGELSNPLTFNIPIDSTTIPNPLPQYVMDSLSNGICFSPNGNFLYITKRYNIYQLEHAVPDSSLAWVHIKQGPDTSYLRFQYYNSQVRGINGKIYIGNWGGTAKQMSVIDYPDLKGLACGFCRKCFRLDSSINFAISTPPNMPDFNLVEDTNAPCWWPLSIPNSPMGGEKMLEVYPNPSSTIVYFKYNKNTNAKLKKDIYTSVGQLLLTTYQDEINVSHFSKGIYYIRCEGITKKLVVE